MASFDKTEGIFYPIKEDMVFLEKKTKAKKEPVKWSLRAVDKNKINIAKQQDKKANILHEDDIEEAFYGLDVIRQKINQFKTKAKNRGLSKEEKSFFPFLLQQEKQFTEDILSMEKERGYWEEELRQDDGGRDN